MGQSVPWPVRAMGLGTTAVCTQLRNSWQYQYSTCGGHARHNCNLDAVTSLVPVLEG